MSDQKRGWDIPADFAEQYNRKAFLTDFPHDGRVETVQGALFQKSDYRPDGLVSLQALDHKGELLRLWMDVPNAMYLMNLLHGIQRRTNADVPTEQPPPTKPHPIQ